MCSSYHAPILKVDYHFWGHTRDDSYSWHLHIPEWNTISQYFLCMLLQQDPFRQFKDLSLLKDQLEDIQRRVENDVQVGVPQTDTFSNLQYTEIKTNNLVSLPYSGWKCAQFTLPQGLFGWVRSGKAAVFSGFGSFCWDLHGHLRCSELSSAKHRADHEKLLQFIQEGPIEAKPKNHLRETVPDPGTWTHLILFSDRCLLPSSVS